MRPISGHRSRGRSFAEGSGERYPYNRRKARGERYPLIASLQERVSPAGNNAPELRLPDNIVDVCNVVNAFIVRFPSCRC